MSDCGQQLKELATTLQTLQTAVTDLPRNLGATFLAKLVEHVKDGVTAEIKKGLTEGLGKETTKILTAVTTGVESAFPAAAAKLGSTVGPALAGGVAAAAAAIPPPPRLNLNRRPAKMQTIEEFLADSDLERLMLKAGVGSGDAGAYADLAKGVLESEDYKKLSRHKGSASVIAGLFGALLWPLNPVYFVLLPFNLVLFFCLWLYVLANDITDTGVLSKVLFFIDTSGHNDAITKGYRVAWWMYVVGIPINWLLVTLFVWLGWTGGEFAVKHPELLMALA
jgi:hypothetical protein